MSFWFLLKLHRRFDDEWFSGCIMGRKKNVKKTKIRVAHELPKRRKMAIQEALAAHQTEDRPEWDRSAEWGKIRLFRKIIKPGTIRTVSLPCLRLI